MYSLRYIWDLSSAGRASALQAEGHRFEPYRSHLWRDSSVGQSTRFIPVVSWVQIPLSLLTQRKRSRKVSLSLFYYESGLLKQCENTVVSWGARRPVDVCSAPTGAGAETKSLSRKELFITWYLMNK